MRKEEIKYSFIGMEPTDALKEYGLEKLSKHGKQLDKVLAMELVYIDNRANRGVKTDFEFIIKVSLPKSQIVIEEIGADMYALIDKASDILVKRFKRYFDKFQQWEGKKDWETLPVSDLESESDVDETEDYLNITPKISKRIRVSENRPLAEAEAIEQMELSGMNQIMFKSLVTGLYTMIYKDMAGKYKLVDIQSEI